MEFMCTESSPDEKFARFALLADGVAGIRKCIEHSNAVTETEHNSRIGGVALETVHGAEIPGGNDGSGYVVSES